MKHPHSTPYPDRTRRAQDGSPSPAQNQRAGKSAFRRLAALFRGARTAIRLTQRVIRSLIRLIIQLLRLFLLFLILAGLYILLVKPLRHTHHTPAKHPAPGKTDPHPSFDVKSRSPLWIAPAGADSAWFFPAPGRPNGRSAKSLYLPFKTH